MAKIERKHEVLGQALSDELLRNKAADGWRAVSVVWERTVEGEAEEAGSEAVPYGLRVSADCSRLEPDTDEIKVMLHMLKGIVDDNPFSKVAADLNERGNTTRDGDEWNQTSIFHMLPRLIEVAPTIFNSKEWISMKPGMLLNP